MTEPTRGTDGTNALACQAALYRRETYLAVKFVLKNVRSETITVDYRQTVPDDLTDSHLSFTSNYMGDAWEFEDATLEFSADIESGEQIETVYGIKRVGMADLVDFIRYATIVVRQNGKTIETVTGIEPDIEGDHETATESDADADEGPDEADADEGPDEADADEGPDEADANEGPDEADSGDGDRLGAAAGTRTEDDAVSGGDTSTHAADGPAEMEDATSASDATHEQPGSGRQVDQSPSAIETEEIAGEHSVEDSPAGRDEAIEWETLSSGVNDVDATDEGEATAVENSHVPFSERDRETDAATAAAGEPRTERPPALPANPSDYILEDVRGEIESKNEFEWVDLDGGADTGSDDGLLGWLRSRLPL